MDKRLAMRSSFLARPANKTITDLYSKLREDVTFRKKVAEQVGIGFELPGEKPEPAPNCTQIESASELAQLVQL